MPGYGTMAYGATPYGGGGPATRASDGFSISDSSTRQLSFTRNVAESWPVSDSVDFIGGFDPNAFDSVGISDSAADTRNLPRSPNDSWTLHDVATGVHIPYVDQPTHLALKADGVSLYIRPGGSMTLSPGTATLELQSGAATSTLNPEKRNLAVDDERGGLWTDG